MKPIRLQLAFVTTATWIMVGCSNSLNQKDQDLEQNSIEEHEIANETFEAPHEYGGWFCPDNLGGFPPMDIQDISGLDIITDRLPTEEETWYGRSLIYIDTLKHPDAYPLDLDLPRVARIHAQHNDMDELVIIIQAAVIGHDTIVGYRFPHGGNGSSWLRQVELLSMEALREEGSLPMVYINEEVHASKEELWKAFTKTHYAKQLGTNFQKAEFFSSDWSSDTEEWLHYEQEHERAQGMVAHFWGNIYLHIDYETEGQLYTEKMLLMEDPETGVTSFQFVSGPHPSGFHSQQKLWNDWAQEVKRGL